MARHLLIGNDGTVVADANVVADGGIDVQKQGITDADGATSVTAADTGLTAPIIRIVQGTAAGNVYSPWFASRNVINWSAELGAAGSGSKLTYTMVGAISTGGAYVLSFKVINTTNGVVPFEIKNYDVTIAAGKTAAEACTSLITAITNDPPHWIKTVGGSTPVLELTGYQKGETKRDGSIQGDLARFKFADNSADWSTPHALTSAAFTAGTVGVGGGHYVLEMEKSLQGIGAGYYNRIDRPIAPATQAVVATNYDMYSIVATKDGSTTSGINGVDNLIEITIAHDGTTAANTTALEAQLNGLFSATDVTTD